LESRGKKQESNMRIVVTAMAVLALAASVGVEPGQAQSKGPKPWCIANGSYGHGSMDCTYWTFKQCTDSASGAGGTCVENPEILWARRGQPTSRQDQNRFDQRRN
jgi:hypothetical protein